MNEKLFIRLVNGQPYEHPITEQNVKQAFPHIDIDNLPADWVPFKRIPIEDVNLERGVYERLDARYEMRDGVVQDVWFVRPKNAEEIAGTNAFLFKNLQHIKWSALELWNRRLLETVDPTSQQLIRDYIAVLEAYEITYEVLLNDMPQSPIKNDDGTYSASN